MRLRFSLIVAVLLIAGVSAQESSTPRAKKSEQNKPEQSKTGDSTNDSDSTDNNKSNKPNINKADGNKKNPDKKNREKTNVDASDPEKTEPEKKDADKKDADKKDPDKKSPDKSEPAKKGQGSADEAKRKNANRKGVRFPDVVAKRETVALEFVAEHHPELSELLGQLKIAHPAQYQAALRDLLRAADRISTLKDPALYELDLEDWKLDSRINLLAARIAMEPNLEQQAELKSLLVRHNDVRLKRLELERSRLESRLEKLNTQIEKHRADPARAAQVRYDMLLRQIAKASALRPANGDKNPRNDKNSVNNSERPNAAGAEANRGGPDNNTDKPNTNKTNPDKPNPDKANTDKTTPDKTTPDKTTPDKTGPGKVETQQNKPLQDKP